MKPSTMMIQFENEKYAMVVANGDQLSFNLLKKMAQKSDFLLAADGGANHLFQMKIRPHAILGDLDSLHINFFQGDVKVIPRLSQEVNDLEKSILFLRSSGYQNILLTGVHGQRDDHFFAALQLVKKYLRKVRISILTDYSEIFALGPGNHRIFADKDKLFSVFGFPRGYEIRTENLKYPLKGENLFESSRGISNVSLANQVTIQISKGCLLIFRNTVR
ncbi:MAG: thiamine diphosphokinase [Candidatus Marinimicrobia bacterium]|nr:thiamine diphosphokinase [Candidatus Neomarinimicrobiota bacterium]